MGSTTLKANWLWKLKLGVLNVKKILYTKWVMLCNLYSLAIYKNHTLTLAEGWF
jgi:hypothetical protein